MARTLKTKRVKRLLLAGGVALLGGLIYWAAPYFEDLQGGEDQVAVKQQQLLKYRQALAQSEGLQERLETLKQVLLRVESGLLSAETPALAAVDIQNLLGEIAGRSGVEVRTVRVLKPEKLKSATYLGVPVEFSMRTRIVELKHILYEIENTSKYLTVEKLRITVARSRIPGEIQSDITLRGYMRNPG